MAETFKHISIFIVFLISAFYLSQLEDVVEPYFNFDYGRSAMLLSWSTGMVILFHLIYHYLGSKSDKIIYVSALSMIGLTCLLSNLDIIRVS